MIDTLVGFHRTGYCGTLRGQDEGREVALCGWVQRQRDLGQLLFIDLRDRTGIVQLAFDDTTARDLFDKAFTVRSEFVLAAVGTVRERSSKNKDIPTGDIEVAVTELRILNRAETLLMQGKKAEARRDLDMLVALGTPRGTLLDLYKRAK